MTRAPDGAMPSRGDPGELPGMATPGPSPVAAAASPEAILVANSGIQFLDLAVDRAAASAVSIRYFECHDAADGLDDEPTLHQVELDDEGVFYHPLTGEVGDAAQTYTVTGVRAFEAFAGAWVPVPVLKAAPGSPGGPARFEEGPTNWARLMVAPAPAAAARDGEGEWRLVLALDTTVQAEAAPTPPVATGAPTAPTPADVAGNATFAFTADLEAIGAFVNEPWVDEWLVELWRDGHPAEAASGATASARPKPGLAHLAHYLTLLAVVAGTRLVPRFLLAAPSPTGETRSVAADLVLDLGSSRTVALLAEDQLGGVAIGPVDLRDLGRPWEVARGAFASRIEFARPSFGKEVYSRWSGRTNAFAWPSLVRTGPEALRLAADQPAVDALTGLSSPMPYLWDARPSRGLWRFSGVSAQAGRRHPLVSGPLLAHLTEGGDVIVPDAQHASGDAPRAATKPRFSRASLLTLLAAELVLQALSSANGLAWRAGRPGSGLPRRLARIVVVLPTAVDRAEAAEAIRRIEAGVRLVWAAFGWGDAGEAGASLSFAPPAVVLGPDAATAAQLAYLENEIGYKLGGKARRYFDLVVRGGRRAGGRGVRLATLDIGGSSTSLAVRSWHLDDGGGLVARSLVAEGFRVGGDDVCRALAERFLIPALARRLTECKVSDAHHLLRGILGADATAATTRQEEMRRRFAAEIALPLARALLAETEVARTARDDGPAARTVADLLATPSPGALSLADEIGALAADDGADGFDLLDTEVAATRSAVAAVVREVLASPLACSARAIANLGADTVLLTGWLARLPSVRDALLEGVPLRPDRVIAMHDYRVGPWYPDRSPSSNVADPKGLAAVGAVLASRLVPAIAGHRLDTDGGLSGRPAGRAFVGPVGPDGCIAADAVLFEIDPPSPGREAAARPAKATLSGDPPFVLGLRRAPLESWPALPLARLDLADIPPDARPRFPLRVTVGWQGGLPTILRALDADGIDLAPGELEVRLDTLGASEGHWLDTGAFRIQGPLVQR